MSFPLTSAILIFSWFCVAELKAIRDPRQLLDSTFSDPSPVDSPDNTDSVNDTSPGHSPSLPETSPDNGNKTDSTSTIMLPTNTTTVNNSSYFPKPSGNPWNPDGQSLYPPQYTQYPPVACPCSPSSYWPQHNYPRFEHGPARREFIKYEYELPYHKDVHFAPPKPYLPTYHHHFGGIYQYPTFKPSAPDFHKTYWDSRKNYFYPIVYKDW